MDDPAGILLRDICDSNKVFKLSDGATLALGRNPETQILDTRCSRVQLLLTPNVNDSCVTVTVEHVGNNPSAINGVKLTRGEKRKLEHNDILEVLESCYFFKLEIPPKTVNHVEGMADSSKGKEKKICSGSLEHFLKDSVLPPPGGWKSLYEDCLIVFSSNDIQSKSKVAAFDLDGTIITTKSGHVFARDVGDWKIAFGPVVDKLKELCESDFKIVLFTNQSGIGRGTLRVSDFKKKIESIVRKLSMPVQVFIATKDDIYRKPRPGMWRHFVEHENDDLRIDYDESFFCGDAAGRPAHCEPNKKKKDFSSADRLFALNVKLKFFTPEEYFLSWKKAPFTLPEFCSASLPKNTPLLEPESAELVSKHQEIIVMIGCPGSGKTFFSKTYLVKNGYVHVNRDTLKTWQKCVALAEKSIQENRSVVVDNTSPDKDARARYTSLAKRFNIPCRVFWMNTTLDHAKHNNTFRQLKNDDVHDFIPNHSLNSFFKILEPPTLEEGFAEIVRVNLIPDFKNDADKELYSMYLLE